MGIWLETGDDVDVIGTIDTEISVPEIEARAGAFEAFGIMLGGKSFGYYNFGNINADIHGITMSVAMGIILFFTFYISVAGSVPFLRRFVEMAVIIFGVASLSFFIGWAVKAFFGISL